MCQKVGMYRIAIFEIRPEPEITGYQMNYPARTGTGYLQFNETVTMAVIQYESKIRNTTKLFNPLNSFECSCIATYSDLIRLALCFKKIISLSVLSESSRVRCLVKTPYTVLKRHSEGTKRTEHYPAEISSPRTSLAGTRPRTG